MPDFFDNDYVVPLVVEYNKLDPSSEEAKLLANKIMIEASNIISYVIVKHKLHRFSSYDDVYSVGLESAFSCLKRFRPNNITKKGKKTNLFSYISSSVENGIRWHNGRVYKEKLKYNTTSLEALDGEIHYDDIPTFEVIADFRSKYRHLFTTNHKMEMFDVMCDFWETDPAHINRFHTMKYLKSIKLKTYYGKIATPHIKRHYYNFIMKKIKEYNAKYNTVSN